MSDLSLSQKRVLVAGAGVSGIASARFCLGAGSFVVLADDRERDSLSQPAQNLEKEGVTLVCGGIAKAVTGFDLCVLSPGISIFDPRIKALSEAGAEVISEIELAARFLKAPILAITGTNGKTTATELTGKILKDAGKRVFVGGNVGTPLIEAVGGDYEIVVAEISSFQLEGCSTFRPKVSVWLNLTGDHLERHADMEEYGGAKARIFKNQDSSDAAVVNRDDPLVWAYAQKCGATLLPYTTKGPLGVGAWKEGEELVVLMPGRDGARLPLGGLKLKGLHNIENVLACLLATAVFGVPLQNAWESACQFKGLPHRVEEFLVWRGITFIDDSKATNVDAVMRAVQMGDSPLILLMGGVEKNSDYSPIRAGLEKRCKMLILVGPNVGRMESELRGSAPIRLAANWAEGGKIALGE
ncbi:UDP-N-acetylmuramoyl-L-alanine--D-glutamate ligase, partial [bacterium]